MKILAQEYDKMLKLTALIFVNALMRIAGYRSGIVRIEYPEVFTQESNRKILDFPVLSREGFYILFEFHKLPLTTKVLLRNFQYLADFRVKVKHPVVPHIICLDINKRSVRSVQITPDWSFDPGFTFLMDFDGDKILSTINEKLNNNIQLTDMDAYFLAVLPFTDHEKSMEDMSVELIYWVNEVAISEEFKYIIKMSQRLWVDILIDDEALSEELMDVIKMRSKFLQNYERNLVKSAVDSAVDIAVVSAINERDAEIADKMLAKGYGHDEILELTGVDISKK